MAASLIQAQDTLPDTYSDPFYGPRYFVSMDAADTAALHYNGDTLIWTSNDSLNYRYIKDSLIVSGNLDVENQLSEQSNRVATRVWSTLQNVTDAGNITTNNISTGQIDIGDNRLINNGEYITVTDKNKTHVYASDNMASYLIHQDRVWDGSAWIGTHNY
ncbi:MAG: hypothetical protein K9J21_07380, partial [Bacteroidales bacterium]|nr:hypothetical protein [Bacteroidales bacterium]